MYRDSADRRRRWLQLEPGFLLILVSCSQLHVGDGDQPLHDLQRFGAAYVLTPRARVREGRINDINNLRASGRPQDTVSAAEIAGKWPFRVSFRSEEAGEVSSNKQK